MMVQDVGLETRAERIARIDALCDTGRLVQGVRFDGVRGGLIGCVAGVYEHGDFSALTGLPLWLAHVVDRMFEGLTVDEAIALTKTLMRSTCIESDFDEIRWLMAIPRHLRQREWLFRLNEPYARMLTSALTDVMVICECPGLRTPAHVASARKKLLEARSAARRFVPKALAKPTPGTVLMEAATALADETQDDKDAKKLVMQVARSTLEMEAEDWSFRKAAPQRAIQIAVSAEASLETFYSWPIQSIAWSIAWATDVVCPRRSNRGEDDDDDNATATTPSLPGMSITEAINDRGMQGDRRSVNASEWQRERDVLLALMDERHEQRHERAMTQDHAQEQESFDFASI